MYLTASQIAASFHDFEEPTREQSTSAKPGRRTNIALVLGTKGPSFVKSELQKRIGNAEECKMLDRYECMCNKRVTRRNDRYYTLTVKDGPRHVDVIGKIDGYIEADDVVVEHKRRTRGLLHRVPFHERVQCHLYMKMTNTSTCYLIESFGEHMEVHTIQFDLTVWDEIRLRCCALRVSNLN